MPAWSDESNRVTVDVWGGGTIDLLVALRLPRSNMALCPFRVGRREDAIYKAMCTIN
jgi:hypothetical protein